MPLPKPDHSSTADDYWSLPEGQRAELIDGVLYDMASPSKEHQRLVGLAYRSLWQLIDQHGGPCEAYVTPFAVNLNADGSTWVEPDVVVVCDPGKLSERGCEGAPDLVIEVVSPNSRRTDYITKTGRYERAGVHEYWIVDPDTRTTVVYDFGTDGPTLRSHTFGEAIPVGIWDGKAEITLA